MKNSLIRSTVLIAVFSLGVASTPAQTNAGAKSAPATGTTGARTSPVRRSATSESIQEDLKEALSVIQSNHVARQKLQVDNVMSVAIDSMLHTLDPHSNYFDPKEYQEFLTEQRSQYFGIGATIGDLSGPDGKVIATYIKATFEDAPAYKAGLRYGDKIVKFSGPRVGTDGKVTQVADESLLGKPFPEVRSYLRGPGGTTIRLTVEHLNGQQETVSITRGAVPQPSISQIYMIRPGVGYMALSGGFNQTTYEEFADGLEKLKSQGATQLVMDLRGNPGGLVDQVLRIANTFLNDSQLILTQNGRIAGVNRRYRAQNPTPDRSPIVVLVNGGSASASEIFAGAMQDHDRALVVGEVTYGKGLVQQPFSIDNSMLLLTIAKYRTPSGRLIQRDYSHEDYYSYITQGGSLRSDDKQKVPTAPKGAASLTDTGRQVFSGGGITPDVVIKPNEITIERARFENKLASPIFAFALDVITGKTKAFDNYRIDKLISYTHDLGATDYPVTDQMYQAFRQYAELNYKISGAQIDREREFVERTLRTEFVTAAYGTTTSAQVFNDYDNQLQKAIELLPQAKQLAMKSAAARPSAVREN